MKNLMPRKFKFDLLPPHLVAFLTGVLLALIAGVIFRKVIDSMSSPKLQAVDNSKASEQEKISNPTASAIVAAATNSKNTQKPSKKIKMSAKQDAESTASKEHSESSSTPNETSENTKATVQSESTESSPSTVLNQSEGNAEGEYDTWRELLRQVEQGFVEQDPNAKVMLTPRYRHNAKGLAITRGQFLDIVTDKAPANLPTRPQSRTVIYHALSKEDFEAEEFANLVRDSNAEFISLCSGKASTINLENVQRVTVLMDNAKSNIQCLSNIISTHPTLRKTTEFGVIAFTRGVTYFASITSKQKLFSLQMWNPDWLLETTVSLEDGRPKKPALGRAQRLANVARALSQPSDVRVQIPASFRSVHGPALDPVEPTPPRPLILGNFALIPSHMPRGSLVATAYMAPDLTTGRSVTAKLQGIDKTKALVLATQGKSLQFMKVHKDK